MNYARALTLLCFAFLAPAALSAQSTASISGTVFTSDGSLATDAEVSIVELRRTIKVGTDATFRFPNLPAGHYHLQARSARSGSSVADVRVAPGENARIELAVDPVLHSEEIVVSASADSRRASEVYQPIAVVTEEELQRELEPTLGETLNEESGVNSTFFGQGSSRPIIRGLGSDRIRILSDGLGANDASNISPDHAVSIDPGTAEQIEILRGPATLLYGSNAVGGVVNVIDEKIPATVPAEIGGDVDLRVGSVAEEINGGFDLSGGRGSFAWTASAVLRETDDYEIPGAADEHDDEPHERTGVVANSSLDSQTFTLGGSFVGSSGFLGISVNRFDTNYGVPGHASHDEEGGAEEREEEEEFVRIDLEQQRIDLKGELTTLPGFFRNARIRIGHTDYEHTELEGKEIGTRFLSDGIEARIDASHRDIGTLRGSMGVQYQDVELQAIGEEAFVPPNSTKSAAVFAFEELTRGRFDFQFGARYETQDVSTSADLPDRSFDGLSGSVGTIFRSSNGSAIALSLARAIRLPTATELYADGPHAATSQYEIGDIDLNEEESLGIDLSFRKLIGRFRGEINLFQNYFNGFIFDAPTGEEIDELPVFRYQQRDATFRGIEVETHTELFHMGDTHLELEAGGDYVRASIDEGGDLPRIPPLRMNVGLLWTNGGFRGGADVRHYFEQDEVAAFEESTDGYTLVSANVGYRWFTRNLVHDVVLRGTNLTDELARPHVSPLKERAPLPGRDFNLSYRLTF
jgi:iron complex outermembrane recepter protein